MDANRIQRPRQIAGPSSQVPLGALIEFSTRYGYLLTHYLVVGG